MTAFARRSMPPTRVGVALLVVSLAVGAGLGRLTVAPVSTRVLLPALVCPVAGHVVVAVTRRRAGRALSLLAGAAAVAFVCMWWFAPSRTLWGLPTGSSLRALGHLLRQAGHVITAGPTPLPATSGIALCIAAGAGLAAVAGRAALGLALGRARRADGARRPGVLGVARTEGVAIALVPSLGLFCYTALLSSGSGRVWATMLYVGALVIFAAALDAGGKRARRSFAGVAAAVVPVVVVGAAALAVPAAVSPTLVGTHLSAFPFSSGGDLLGPGGTFNGGVSVGPGGDVIGAGESVVVATDLIDDLGAVISSRSQELLFVADTPIPTYWQLGVLTHFDGQRWTADPVTQSVARRGGGTGGVAAVPSLSSGPPVLPEPASSQVYSSYISMGALRTSLLPVPPGTVSVGGGGVELLKGVGVLAIRPSIPGFAYDSVSDLPAPSLDSDVTPSGAPSSGASLGAPGASGASGGASSSSPIASGTSASGQSGTPVPVTNAELEVYLALPKMDPAVVSLAHSIVRGASTPMAKALAIGSYFRSGRFRYSLTSASTGPDSLTSFLFHQRAGFCQQFAGAYAVLARLDGLPTRVAVGFTPGMREPDGSYLVTGADAHVWPEVYLGPTQGWISVEPTPPGGDGQPAQGVLLAPGSGRGAGRPASDFPHKGPNSQPKPLLSIPNVAPPGGSVSLRSGRARQGAGAPVWLWVLAAVAVGAAAVFWRHRLVDVVVGIRSRSGRAAVVHAWRRADRELGRRHPSRLPAETMSEYVERLRGAGAGSSRRWLVPDPIKRLASGPQLAELADMAARACYGLAEPTRAEVARARRLRAEVCAAARGRRRPLAQSSAITNRSPTSSSSSAPSAP